MRQTDAWCAALGTVGGAVGSLVLLKLGDQLFKMQKRETVEREQQLRPELPVEVLAGRAIELFGLTPTKPRKQKLGFVLLWSANLMWGAIYGVVRRRVPVFRSAMGLPFAVAFFLIRDEGINTLLGLCPPPRAFPIAAHARGFATHVAHVATVEATCMLGERALARVGARV